MFDLKATDTFTEGRYSHLRRDRLRQGKTTLIRGNPQHVRNLLELYGMGSAKSAPTPSLSENDPGEESEPISDEEAALYRRAVGILLYLSADRWDVKRDVELAARLRPEKRYADWSAQLALLLD